MHAKTSPLPGKYYSCISMAQTSLNRRTGQERDDTAGSKGAPLAEAARNLSRCSASSAPISTNPAATTVVRDGRSDGSHPGGVLKTRSRSCCISERACTCDINDAVAARQYRQRAEVSVAASICWRSLDNLGCRMGCKAVMVIIPLCVVRQLLIFHQRVCEMR